MPYAAPKPCRHTGCMAVTSDGWCELHKTDKNKAGNRTARDRQARRGLTTSSAHWRRIRAKQLREHPLCAVCTELGLVVPASHVDHIDNDSRNNYMDNLASLCASCHSRKTAQQDGGFGNPQGG